MKAKVVASLLSMVVFFISCAQSSSNNTETSQTSLLVDATTFKATIDKGGVQILDVRTAAEFNSGYIEHALQANWMDEGEFKRRTQFLDKNIPVYIYCASGGRSASAQEYLVNQGFKVTNLEGGMSNWKMKGLPIVGGGAKVQMRIADVDNVIKANDLVLVDIGAEWCPPCRKMLPTMDSLKNDPSIKFYFLAVDGGNDMDVMKHLKSDDLPTFIIYKKGKEVWRHVGIAPLDDFKKILQ
jgi:rhodanese-related sulfurtransferase